jgi:hypothetical protein
MDPQRRSLLAIGASAGALALFAGTRARAEADNPIPGAPAVATPGKPGDFNFLAGEWRIRHRQQRKPGEWDSFDGEATCWTILGGVGSVEELRIPARNFSGMGLRLLDVENRVWSDFWVNARSGVLTTPGLTGSFENGAGIFIADDVDGETPIKVAGIWDHISPTTCRWRQAVSRDAGKTWDQSWIMDWTRAR